MNLPKQPYQQKVLKYTITALIISGSLWSASGLEITLDNMLGYPEKSLSGSKIPLIDRKIEILQNNLLPLNCLPNNTEATIELIAMNDIEKKTLEGIGVMLGLKINKIDDQFVIDDKNINISNSLCQKILARVSRHSIS